MHGHRTILSAALVVTLLAGMAAAGPLATDPAALTSWRGTAHFSNTNGGVTMTADVDYAVYAPGDVETSALLGFPGASIDPSAGSSYVFTFQVFNTSAAVGSGGTNLLTFTDGLGQVLSIPAGASMGHATTPLGGTPPSTNRSIPVSPSSSASWSWVSPALVPGGKSDILYFTWPAPPTWSIGGLQGVTGATIDHQPLPGVPEPGTAVLAGIASLCLLAVHHRRRHKSVR